MSNDRYYTWSVITIKDILKNNLLEDLTDELVEIIVNEINVMDEKESRYNYVDFQRFFNKIIQFNIQIPRLLNT